jgi:hypothetical protein
MATKYCLSILKKARIDKQIAKTNADLTKGV